MFLGGIERNDLIVSTKLELTVAYKKVDQLLYRNPVTRFLLILDIFNSEFTI